MKPLVPIPNSGFWRRNRMPRWICQARSVLLTLSGMGPMPMVASKVWTWRATYWEPESLTPR